MGGTWRSGCISLSAQADGARQGSFRVCQEHEGPTHLRNSGIKAPGSRVPKMSPWASLICSLILLSTGSTSTPQSSSGQVSLAARRRTLVYWVSIPLALDISERRRKRWREVWRACPEQSLAGTRDRRSTGIVFVRSVSSQSQMKRLRPTI